MAVVWCLLSFGGRCSWDVLRRLLIAGRCVLFVARCLLMDVGCML